MKDENTKEKETNLKQDIVINKDDFDQESYSKVNKKNKWKFILGSFLVVVAIAVGIYVGYSKLTSNPVVIYKTAVNDIYEAMKKIAEDGNDTDFMMDDAVTMEMQAKFSSNMEELKALSEIDYSFKMAIDYKNETGSLGLNLKNKDENLNVLASIIDKKAYLKSEALYNKVIDLGDCDLFGELKKISESEELKSLGYNRKDILYLLKEYKGIMIDAINQDKITIEKDAEIEIEGKTKKFKKVSYLFDKENIEATIKTFIKALLDDDKLLEVTAKVIGKDKLELKNELDKIDKDGINLDGYEDIKLEIYADSFNNIVASNILENNQKVIEYRKENSLFSFQIYALDYTLKVQEKEDYMEFKFLENDTEIAQINLYESDNDSLKLDLIMDYQGVKVNMGFLIYDIEGTEDSLNAKYNLTLNVKALGTDANLGFEGEYKLSKGDIEIVDNKEAIEYKKMSKKELKSLSDALDKALEKLGFSDISKELV